jgi:hypothetical protein
MHIFVRNFVNGGIVLRGEVLSDVIFQIKRRF